MTTHFLEFASCHCQFVFVGDKCEFLEKNFLSRLRFLVLAMRESLREIESLVWSLFSLVQKFCSWARRTLSRICCNRNPKNQELNPPLLFVEPNECTSVLLISVETENQNHRKSLGGPFCFANGRKKMEFFKWGDDRHISFAKMYFYETRNRIVRLQDWEQRTRNSFLARISVLTELKVQLKVGDK